MSPLSRMCFSSRVTLAAALLLFGVPSVGTTQTSARLVDLGTLGGLSSFAYGVNDRGDVVGESYIADDRTRHGFLWQRGIMIDLGTLAGHTGSIALDINNQGQIIGNSYDDVETQPFIWSDGVMTALPLLPGHRTGTALSVNDRGQVVGASEGQAVLWDDGVVVRLRVSGSTNSVARGINEQGLVVGVAEVGTTEPRLQAILWEKGVARRLAAPALPGCPDGSCVLSSEAMAISSEGIITGVVADEERLHAVRWSKERGADLGTLPNALDAFLHPGSVNDDGDAAGGASIILEGIGVAVPVVWIDGTIRALPTLDAPIPHATATAISNNRHVVGLSAVSDFDSHAVLWTVTPPDRKAPRIRLTARGGGIIWPPNGKRIPVTFTGNVTDELSGVGNVTFAVRDEYGRVQPQGRVRVARNGAFTITVMLEASRRDSDKNGRRYVLRVTATDKAGNRASATATAVVPHDRQRSS